VPPAPSFRPLCTCRHEYWRRLRLSVLWHSRWRLVRIEVSKSIHLMCSHELTFYFSWQHATLRRVVGLRLAFGFNDTLHISTALPSTLDSNPSVPATVPPKRGRPQGSLSKVKNPKAVALGPRCPVGRPRGSCKKREQAADDRQEVDNETQAWQRRGRPTKVDPGPIVSIRFGWMVCYILFVQLISANICFRLCQKPIQNPSTTYRIGAGRFHARFFSQCSHSSLSCVFVLIVS
jgi:hypothetical protein